MADPQHEISIREIPSVVDLPGKPQNEAAEAEFLSIDDQRVQSLLKKLPDIIDYHLQKIPFEKKKSLNPPSKFDTVEVDDDDAGSLDKPPTDIEEGDVEGLRVVRISPSGPVYYGKVQKVTITFSEAMISIASVDDINSVLPAKIEPQPAGKWRWHGSKTLIFEPSDHEMPLSTEYTVTVFGAATSVSGKPLGSDVRDKVVEKFSTKTLLLEKAFPPWKMRRDSPVVLVFSQQIDTDKIFENLTFRFSSSCGGGKKIPYQRVSKEELDTLAESQPYLAGFLKESLPSDAKRWIAFGPISKWPESSRLEAIIKAGVYTTGKLPTSSSMSQSFHTSGAFKLGKPSKYNFRACGGSMIFSLRNEANTDTFNPSEFKVTPPPADLTVTCSSHGIRFEGDWDANVTYTFDMTKTSLEDLEGQALQPQTYKKKPKDAIKVLSLAGREILTTCSPDDKPCLWVQSTNYKRARIHVRQVEPNDYILYNSAWNSWSYTPMSTKDVAPELMLEKVGKGVFSGVIDLTEQKNKCVTTQIDLSKWLQHPDDQIGHLVVTVEPLPEEFKGDYKYHPILAKWVQATNLALSCFHVRDEVAFWTSSLRDGSPVSAEIKTIRATEYANAKTDKTGVGVAAFKLGSGGIVQATNGNDSCLLLCSTGVVKQKPAPDQIEYVFDDRHMYKPKEVVRVRGYIRSVSYEDGFPKLSPRKGKIMWTALDSRNAVLVQSASCKLDKNGSFSIELTLPATVNTGFGRISFIHEDNKNSFEHVFSVQEFRKPQYKVTCEKLSQNAVIHSGTVKLKATAKYFSGAAITGATVSWSVKANITQFRPSNWTEFHFGPVGEKHRVKPQYYTGNVDSIGTHAVEIGFEPALDKLRPTYAILAEASVRDVSYQRVGGAQQSFLVHPAAVYVGLHAKEPLARAGKSFPISVVVVDPSGNPVQGKKVRFSFSKMIRNPFSGALEKSNKETDLGKFTPKGKDPAEYSIKLREYGHLIVQATVQDEDGNVSSSHLPIYVLSGKPGEGDTLAPEVAYLSADKPGPYKPGDVLILSIVSPFEKAVGLFGVNGSAMSRLRRVKVRKGKLDIELLLEPEFAPKIFLSVELVPIEYDPQLPRVAAGHLAIEVDPASLALDVQVSVDKPDARPRDEITATVKVSRSSEAGKNDVTSVSLLVVDDAVLSLSNYSLPKAVSHFFPDVSVVPEISNTRKLIHTQNSNFWSKSSLPVAHLGMACCGCASMRAERAGSIRAKVSSIPRQMEKGGLGWSGGSMQNRKSEQRRHDSNSIAHETILTCLDNEEDNSDSDAEGYDDNSDSEEYDDNSDSSGGFSGSGKEEKEFKNKKVSSRTDSKALAFYAPSLALDEDGTVSATFTLPDSLTSYRVWAVVVSGSRAVGQAETSIRVSLPISVRPVLPRFLNLGDTTGLGAVVVNETGSDIECIVAMKTSNSIVPTKGGAPSPFAALLKVPSGKRRIVRFDAYAREGGDASILMAATTLDGTEIDVTTETLPIWRPVNVETVARYGEVDKDGGAIQLPVYVPKNTAPQIGGIQITLQTTILGELSDALEYLTTYQYESSEQLASKVIGSITLTKVQTGFGFDSATPSTKLKQLIGTSLRVIKSRCRGSGGVSFWDITYSASIWASIHSLHAILVGGVFASNLLDDVEFERRLKLYVARVDNWFISLFDSSINNVVKAYSFYVRAKYENVQEQAMKLFESTLANTKARQKLDILAWCLMATPIPSSATVSTFINCVLDSSEEEGDKITLTEPQFSRHEAAYLFSSRIRTHALVIEALSTFAPTHKVLSQLVRGLLAKRAHGRWSNTQENCFAAIAMQRYFESVEKCSSSVRATAWVGSQRVATHKFEENSIEIANKDVPMEQVLELQESRSKKFLSTPVFIKKDGDGRLYYRVGLQYALDTNTFEPKESGFEVIRTYESVDNKKHVKFNVKKNRWTFAAGERVLVKLSITVTGTRFHVAVVDRLPACLEPINPDIITEASDALRQIPEEQVGPRAFGAPWHDHLNMRDERVEIFSQRMFGGTYEFSYFARATSLGSFSAPPAYAEEMYSPEVFGRSKSESLQCKALGK